MTNSSIIKFNYSLSCKSRHLLHAQSFCFVLFIACFIVVVLLLFSFLSTKFVIWNFYLTFFNIIVMINFFQLHSLNDRFSFILFMNLHYRKHLTEKARSRSNLFEISLWSQLIQRYQNTFLKKHFDWSQLIQSH